MDKELTLTERIRIYADGDSERGVQPHGFDFSHEDAENMMSALRLVWLISREDCAHNFQHEREDLQDYIRVMNAMIKIAKNFVDRCPMKAEFRLQPEPYREEGINPT